MSTATLYAVSHVTGNASSPNNALDAPDNVWTADGNLANSWTSRWRLDVVAGAFQPSGTQTITLRVRKGGNSGNPSISSVTLWQGGTQLATISGGAITVTSTTGVDQTFTFDGSLLSGFTDVDIQVAVTSAGGGPAVRNSVELDAITWDAAFQSVLTADFAATEAQDTASGSASAYFAVDLVATEARDAMEIVFELPSEPAFPAEAFAPGAFYATSLDTSADLAATEVRDTAAIALAARHTLSLAATEASDTAAIALAARHTLSLAATEVRDTAAFSVATRASIDLAATEAPDTATVALAARHTLSLAATEASDTAAVGMSFYWPASFALTETPDTAAFSLSTRFDVALAATEARDTASIALAARHTLSLAATEARDIAALDISVQTEVDFAVTEARDVAALQVVRVVPFEVGAGAVTFTGNAADLVAARFLYPDVGQMNIAGLPVNFVYFRAIAAGSQEYVITGYSARLYQSSFFYNDTEITFAPQEVRALTIYFEDRVIRVPANPDIKRLAEYREADGEPRLRAI
jgi:hypothetical protein